MTPCAHEWANAPERRAIPRALLLEGELNALRRDPRARPPASWPAAPLHCQHCGIVWPGEQRLPAAVAA